MDTYVDTRKPETPPANQRHLADSLADPTRVERSRQAHRDALRKLSVAAAAAASTGATWDEIHQAVRAGVADAAEVGGITAVSSATARARIHGGDDRL